MTQNVNQPEVVPPMPERSRRLLDPVERVSEILFGLIMALTFTLTISLVESDTKVVKDMLLAAISCNIAWGIVDAVMYTLSSLATRGHDRKILNFVRKSPDSASARQFISESMPVVVANAVSDEELEKIRLSLVASRDPIAKAGLTITDVKTALGVFLLVFLSTLPIALPFLFIHDAMIALRVSNATAILLMFICGWLLASYGGFNKWVTGFLLVLLGVILVSITIALGG